MKSLCLMVIPALLLTTAIAAPKKAQPAFGTVVVRVRGDKIGKEHEGFRRAVCYLVKTGERSSNITATTNNESVATFKEVTPGRYNVYVLGVPGCYWFYQTKQPIVRVKAGEEVHVLAKVSIATIIN